MEILLPDTGIKLAIILILCFQLLTTLFVWTNRHIDPNSKAIFTVFIWILPIVGAGFCAFYLIRKKLARRKSKFARRL